MKIAGRVLPAYKGEYSSSKTYDILDTVTYRNSSWLCIRSNTTGIIPSTANSDNWHLISLGISPELNQALNDRVEQYDEMIETVNEQAAEARDAAEVAKKSAEIATARSNAIVQKVEGESIVVNDSSDDLLRGLRVFGKTEQVTTTGAQLFDVSTLSYTQKYTVDKDGYIIFSNNSTYNEFPSATISVPKGTYTVHIKIASITGNAAVYATKQPGDYSAPQYANKVVTLYDTEQIYLLISGTNGASVKVRIMVNVGDDTVLPWEPYTNGPSPNPQYPQELVSAGDDGDVEVGVYGKNLFKQIWGKVPSIHSGLDVSVDPNAVSSDYIRVDTDKEYTLSTDVAFSDCYLFAYDADKSFLGHVANKGTLCQFPILVRAYPSVQYLRIRFDLTEHGNFQFENGSVSTDYEPYKGKTLTVLTPNGLPAIPVTDASLATYTDADGTMWCADEIDFERGVYVKRVGIKELDGSDGEGWEILTVTTGQKMFRLTMSGAYSVILDPAIHGVKSNVGYAKYSVLDNGGYGLTWAYGVRVRFEHMNPENNTLDEFKAYLAENPITVIYPLATPIETPLSEEELTQYRALHSNYPVTTVLNDSGVNMEMKYNADTKNYIDNKFAELQTALVALGGI